MKASDSQHSALRPTSAPRINPRLQTSQIGIPSRKFRPASRAERLSSWNQRMQSLFTRQTY